MPKKSREEQLGKEAGLEAFKFLQQELKKRKAGLEKVALCLKQGLSATTTFFAQWNGEFTDDRKVADYKTRSTYCKLIMDVFGANAPTKHQVTGDDGEPLTVTLKWPTNGNSENSEH